MTSAKIYHMTTAEWNNLPVGALLCETFGWSYRYLRCKKINEKEYAGVKCYLDYDDNTWKRREIPPEEFNEKFCELKPESFNEKRFSEHSPFLD